jgi:hypothetical protein
MKIVLGVTFQLILLFIECLSLGAQAQIPTKPTKLAERPPCNLESLPLDIQTHLKNDFGSWRVQQPTDLSALAHERWEGEKPLACPGIAVGQFDNAKTPSYAILLVPREQPDGGYKFLVFSANAVQPSYQMRIIEQSSEGGASIFFIHSVRVSRLFDEASRKKFKVQTNDCILFVGSGEKGYEADVYFWATDRYQHEPVDY